MISTDSSFSELISLVPQPNDYSPRSVGISIMAHIHVEGSFFFEAGGSARIYLDGLWRGTISSSVFAVSFSEKHSIPSLYLPSLACMEKKLSFRHFLIFSCATSGILPTGSSSSANENKRCNSEK